MSEFNDLVSEVDDKVEEKIDKTGWRKFIKSYEYTSDYQIDTYGAPQGPMGYQKPIEYGLDIYIEFKEVPRDYDTNHSFVTRHKNGQISIYIHMYNTDGEEIFEDYVTKESLGRYKKQLSQENSELAMFLNR
jgi:hypothetical protein